MRSLTFWLLHQVGKDAVIIEADAIKNRDAMYKHLSSWDLTRDDPTLSSYVHEYSTKAAEILLAAAGVSFAPVLYPRHLPSTDRWRLRTFT